MSVSRPRLGERGERGSGEKKGDGRRGDGETGAGRQGEHDGEWERKWEGEQGIKVKDVSAGGRRKAGE